MKTKLVPTALVLALAGTLTAAAQDGDRKPERERRGPPPELLKKFDKDGDGKLNEEERNALREAMQKRRGPGGPGPEMHKKMLEKFDTDGDGKLSEDERKAAREAMEARRKEILEKYDTDGDGKLSPEERKAAIDAGEKIGPPPGRPGRPPGPEGRRGPRPEGDAPDA